jgi:hypothetical protein
MVNVAPGSCAIATVAAAGTASITATAIRVFFKGVLLGVTAG